jgi:hypothetical protein
VLEEARISQAGFKLKEAFIKPVLTMAILAGRNGDFCATLDKGRLQADTHDSRLSMGFTASLQRSM